MNQDVIDITTCNAVLAVLDATEVMIADGSHIALPKVLEIMKTADCTVEELLREALNYAAAMSVIVQVAATGRPPSEVNHEDRQHALEQLDAQRQDVLAMRAAVAGQ